MSDDYRPADIDVEVLVDGVWHSRALRAWWLRDAQWHGHVMWIRGPSQNYLGTFPEEQTPQRGSAC